MDCEVAPGDECFGIRPGALMQAEAWTICTANFVFANATDLFIGTAAHCVNGVGNKVWFYNTNATAPGLDTSKPAHGEAVFVPEEWDQPNYTPDMGKWDFALVRINPAYYADVVPAICAWDGPHGLHNETGSSTDQAYFYGHGVGISAASPARIGIGPTWDGGPIFHMRSATNNGDSGGPWIDDQGHAIGHETAAPGASGLSQGTDLGVHIQWVLQITAERGLPLRLIDAGEDPLAVMQSLAAPGTAPPQNEPTNQDRDVPGTWVSVLLLTLAGLSILRRRR